jgi:hypothetical protein
MQSYFWIDQCDNPINKVLTMLAYTHVMFQVCDAGTAVACTVDLDARCIY